MEISWGGNRIDANQKPIEAAILCLNASSNAGSKAKAWSRADDAVFCLAKFDQATSEKLLAIISKSGNNFPNASDGLAFVKGLMQDDNRTYCRQCGADMEGRHYGNGVCCVEG